MNSQIPKNHWRNITTGSIKADCPAYKKIKMAFLWAGIGFGKTKHRSGSNDQKPRNLQEGLLQIGTQAWHILVHANNNNIGTYEDDKNKNSDCITSLVEIAATGEKASNKNQQLVMLIPHVSSRITQPKERKRSKAKQVVKKSGSGGGCNRLDGALDDTEFELWDSRFMLRGDHEPDICYKHAQWGPRGWCKPSCIPITIILILIVLVVLLPLMDQKEANYNKSLLCHQTCRFSLVESIPDGLTYPNSTAVHPATHDVWFDLIKLAQHSIEIGSFYWTLRSADVTPGDPSSQKGEEIFQALLNTGLEKKVSIRIAQNFPSHSKSPLDTEILAKSGAAEVRSVNFTKLMGGGVLHTKLWIIDRQHFYVGSANMDWRSLTEVKELGLAVYNCSCLASDLAKIFEVYWFLGNPDAKIPAKWPDSLSTRFNIETPMTLMINSSSRADVYIASSPPPFCPEGRSTDIDAIIDIISKAERFIYISVMDYFPLQIYTPELRYWPKIDNALRAAAIDRHIQVRLLISNWKHTQQAARYFLQSLIDINGAYRGVVVDVKWFRVPSTPQQEKIPFARVNHNKYMVTDNTAYIGTSNWSGDYFVNTAGVGVVVRTADSKNDTSTNPLRDQLQQVFERDWNSKYASPLV